MKVLNVKVLAKRNGPESCGGARKCTVEALTGDRAGCVLSREIQVPGADVVRRRGRQHWVDRIGEIHSDRARSKATRMHVRTMCGNREILRLSEPGPGAERVMNPKGARSR